MKPLYTTELARAAGVHPNTVRRYAERGLIPPVERAANGYRVFTQRHLDCLRVARLLYGATFAGRAIRASGSATIERAVADDWGGALELAYAHLSLVRAERAQADAALMLLERWASGAAADATTRPMRIGQVARLLGLSVDVLHNWEANGFISVPREPGNGYRTYSAADISRLRVVRMLSRAGYSQMAILRMLIQLDRGNTADLRATLDTPAPDEDVRIASNRWLSALAEQEEAALSLISLIEGIIASRVPRQASPA